LWSITIPLTVSATTTTSTLDWTNTAYTIKSIAYNGANGSNGTNGSNGSATFVITRSANDSSAPTPTEVYALLGRYAVAGDICTVSYNAYNNAVVYQYVTSWSLFATYITGSLIVQNTITADKMVANIMSADNVLTRGLTVRDNSGNIILAAGSPLAAANISPSSTWLNSNVSINADGTLSGAGSGQVSLGGLGAGAFATLNQITSGNISTYIAGAAIGTAYIANAAITNALIDNLAVSTANIQNAAITTAKIGTAQVDTLQIAGNAVTVPVATSGSSNITLNTSTWSDLLSAYIDAGSGNNVAITASASTNNTTGFPYFYLRIMAPDGSVTGSAFCASAGCIVATFTQVGTYKFQALGAQSSTMPLSTRGMILLGVKR
jgi:hypothetical protein